MKKLLNKIFFLLFISSLFTILSTINGIYALTIGSDTGKIDFRNVLRGGYASYTITLTTDSPNPLIVSPIIVGEASSWIRIEPENISLKLDNPAKIKIIVNPPQDIANGNYTSTITFYISDTAIPTTKIGSKILTSISIITNIEVVGIEIKSCDASIFLVPDIEVNNNPIIRVKVLNTGNVRLKPVANIILYDKNMTNEIFNGNLYSNKEILPTEEEDIFYEVPIKLKLGQYWAKISLLECGVSTISTFDVLEVGGLTDKGEFMRIDYRGEPYVGKILEIFAVFRNTGYRPVTANFKGKIEFNGEIIRLIDTQSITIEPGKVGYIPFFFKPEKPGKYVISGRVSYNNKLSYEKSQIIEVREEEETPNIIFFVLIIISSFILAIILTKIYSLKKIRRFRIK